MMQLMMAFSLGLMDGLSSAKTTKLLLLGHTKMVNRETIKLVKQKSLMFSKKSLLSKTLWQHQIWILFQDNPAINSR